MKQVLRKFLKKTIEGNTETIINERIEKELLTKDELQELLDQFGNDDYEDQYHTYGFVIDYQEELSSIILDTLAEGLRNFLKDEEEYESLKEIGNKIEPWRAYDLDFESEPTGAKGEEK